MALSSYVVSLPYLARPMHVIDCDIKELQILQTCQPVLCWRRGNTRECPLSGVYMRVTSHRPTNAF